MSFGTTGYGGGARGGAGFTTRIGAYERPPEYDAAADPHLAEFWRRREAEERRARKRSRAQGAGGASGGPSGGTSGGAAGGASRAHSPSRRARGGEPADADLYGSAYQAPLEGSRSSPYSPGRAPAEQGRARRAEALETSELYHERPLLQDQPVREPRVSQSLRSPSRPSGPQSPGQSGSGRQRLRTAPAGTRRGSGRASGSRGRSTLLDSVQQLWDRLGLAPEERDYAYSRIVSSPLLAKAYAARLRDVASLRSSFVKLFRARQRAIEELREVFSSGRGSRRRLFADLRVLHSSTMRLASLTNSVRVLCGKPVNLPTLQVATDPSKNFLIYLLIENVFTRQNLAMAMAALQFEGAQSLVACTNRVQDFFDNCKRYCAAGAEGEGEGGAAGDPGGRSATPAPGEGAAGGDALDSSPLTDDIISLYFVLGIVVGDDFPDHDLPDRWVSFLLAGPPEGQPCDDSSPLLPDDVYAMINAEVDLVEDYQQMEGRCAASSVRMALVPVSGAAGSVEVYEARGGAGQRKAAVSASPTRGQRSPRPHGSSGDQRAGRRTASPRRARHIAGDRQLECVGLDFTTAESPSPSPGRPVKPATAGARLSGAGPGGRGGGLGGGLGGESSGGEPGGAAGGSPGGPGGRPSGGRSRDHSRSPSGGFPGGQGLGRRPDQGSPPGRSPRESPRASPGAFSGGFSGSPPGGSPRRPGGAGGSPAPGDEDFDSGSGSLVL